MNLWLWLAAGLGLSSWALVRYARAGDLGDLMVIIPGFCLLGIASAVCLIVGLL